MTTLSFFPEIAKIEQNNLSLNLKELSKNQAAIKEIQTLLIKGEFYDTDKTSGILDKPTTDAFAEFKKRAYLQYPDQIGRTTAQALLEIVEVGKHPFPIDNLPTLTKDIPLITDKKIKLPGNTFVGLKEPIDNSIHFTWSEATKNGTRIPESIEVIKQIVKTANYLNKIRIFLGNRPISINSWHRPLKINISVGGVSNSTHIFGHGVDFIVSGIPPLEVYKLLNNFHKGRGGLGKSNQFTHLDMRGYLARWVY